MLWRWMVQQPRLPSFIFALDSHSCPGRQHVASRPTDAGGEGGGEVVVGMAGAVAVERGRWW